METGIRCICARLCQKCKRSKPIDIKALNDCQPLVQWYAASALGDIGSGQTVDPLIQVLKKPDHYARRWAAEALGEIKDSRAIEPLK